jgi:hypothetical protein
LISAGFSSNPAQNDVRHISFRLKSANHLIPEILIADMRFMGTFYQFDFTVLLFDRFGIQVDKGTKGQETIGEVNVFDPEGGQRIHPAENLFGIGFGRASGATDDSCQPQRNLRGIFLERAQSEIEIPQATDRTAIQIIDGI